MHQYIPEIGTSDYSGPIVVHQEVVASFRGAGA
jgi:hypothetical protein